MALSFIWLIQFRIADFIALWNIVAGGPKPKNVFLLSILNFMKWTINFLLWQCQRNRTSTGFWTKLSVYNAPNTQIFLALSWHKIALFLQYSENTAFFSSFLLAESTAKAFCRLILFDFKEKSINHFLRHNHFFTWHPFQRKMPLRIPREGERIPKPERLEGLPPFPKAVL